MPVLSRFLLSAYVLVNLRLYAYGLSFPICVGCGTYFVGYRRVGNDIVACGSYESLGSEELKDSSGAQ